MSLVLLGALLYFLFFSKLLSDSFRADYFADFLRLAKNRPAATIMMAQPPMVKIVVPMPPVEGRLANFVLTKLYGFFTSGSVLTFVVSFH